MTVYKKDCNLISDGGEQRIRPTTFRIFFNQKAGIDSAVHHLDVIPDSE